MMRIPTPPSTLLRAGFPLLPARQRGFTLVEMIMVIVITGIIGGVVAVFLRAPIQQYMDVARRAEMTDIADTALRRISRDLRQALPNSVRVTGACGGGGTCFIEFLPTIGGGRYRAEAAPAGATAGCGSLAADVLDAGVAADGCFEVLGPMPAAAAGDEIVVYNLGIPGADAYAGNNRSAVTAAAATTITITPFLYPFDSPGHRFHVVSTPVTYACAPAAGGVGGTLTRWQGYPIQAAQPVASPGGTTALLATNVSNCSFAYDGFVVAQRSGLVTMHLGITEEGEAVNLYSATHVSNQP